MLFMKTILVDAIDGLVLSDGTVFAEMLALLEHYPNRKIVLTGANDEQMAKFGLDQLPYEVFTLKHNPEKTDPQYYETMLQHFGYATEDVVYFEHNQAAVDSAIKNGITTYFYDHQKQDLVALKAFLDQQLL